MDTQAQQDVPGLPTECWWETGSVHVASQLFRFDSP
jgi:hypothetical protein